MTSPPHPPDQRAGGQDDLPATEVTLDAASMSTREINRSLRALPCGKAVVVNPAGRHNLAVGLDAPLLVEIDGPAGFYAGGLGKRSCVTVNGPAGDGVAENLMSGEVRVRGSAGRGAAASAHGGLVVVDGGCAPNAAISLKGATLAIGGNAGAYCAALAQSGVVLGAGDAGPCLGDSMYEAVVYVGGKIAGLGAEAVVQEHDVKFVGLLAARCGFGHLSPADVTKIVSIRRLYNLHGDDHGTYR